MNGVNVGHIPVPLRNGRVHGVRLTRADFEKISNRSKYH